MVADVIRVQICSSYVRNISITIKIKVTALLLLFRYLLR
jgi:hypothetical protein